jgi:hypothetical protein
VRLTRRKSAAAGWIGPWLELFSRLACEEAAPWEMPAKEWGMAKTKAKATAKRATKPSADCVFATLTKT